MNKEEYLEKLTAIYNQDKPDKKYIVSDHPDNEGIITVGGGKYWYGIYVMIRLVRSLGYKGAIQVWYRGSCEAVYPDDLGEVEERICPKGSEARYVKEVDTLFVDVDKVADIQKDSRIPKGITTSGGWEAKLYALYHTTLKRVAFIDADAYFINNPEPLFRLLDEYAFIYWQDLMSQERAIKWAEVWPEQDKGVMQVQGGQIFMDREKAWRLIHGGNFMCQNSDYYFRFIYGDQDTWRIGLAATMPKFLNIGPAIWQGVAFICIHDKIQYVVHRCQGKLYAFKDIPAMKMQYSNPQYHLPAEAKVFDYLAEAINKRGMDASESFNQIYNKRLWGGDSGAGSRMREAEPYIKAVNALIESKGAKTVIDVGCGDGLVGAQLKCGEYIGLDVVGSIIRQCKIRYPKKNYFCLDIYRDCDIIPIGDILLCKDVLHHWPNEWVEKWLTSLIESKKWNTILICQDEKQMYDNQDCHLGGYRGLNIEMKPLSSFPFRKLQTINHKALLMWERSQ